MSLADVNDAIELWGYSAVQPHGVIILDVDSNIVTVTKPFCDLTGHCPLELKKMNLSDIIPAGTNHPHHESLKPYIKNGNDPLPMKPLSDVPLICANGKIKRVSVERGKPYCVGGELRFSGRIKEIESGE